MSTAVDERVDPPVRRPRDDDLDLPDRRRDPVAGIGDLGGEAEITPARPLEDALLFEPVLLRVGIEAGTTSLIPFDGHAIPDGKSRSWTDMRASLATAMCMKLCLGPRRPVHMPHAPDRRRSSLVDRREHRIEPAQAPETGGQRDLGHRQISRVDQALGACTRAVCATWAGLAPTYLRKQPAKLAGADAEPPGHCLDPPSSSAPVDEAQRPARLWSATLSTPARTAPSPAGSAGTAEIPPPRPRRRAVVFDILAFCA